MVTYEICSAYVKFGQKQDLAQYKDYRLGMVHNSVAPVGVEQEYKSKEEAEKDFADRRSSVVCKNGSLIITEVFLQESEFNGYDEDGYAEPPVRTTLMGIAPIGDKELADRLLDDWRGNEPPEFM
jgi:hypothetical protein